MSNRLTTSVRPRVLPWLAVALLVGCDEQAITPPTVRVPEFSAVVSGDPTRVITVGVDAPANLTVTGTVAGIVVAVDNALVDLSGATLDCRGQATTDDPRVGVWIKGNRSHVHVKGGGTAVVKHCGAAVLVGPAAPMRGEPGGSYNQIEGLVVQEDDCPSGPYEPLELLCPVGIALSNSHNNKVVGNRIAQSEWGIVITGADPEGSGGNDITGNTTEGTQNVGIYVTSDGNIIHGNVSTNVAGQTAGAIRIDGDSNVVTGNTLAAWGFNVRLRDGADDNTVTKNLVPEGWPGFAASPNAHRNTLRENTVLSTEGPSAIDESGGCANNTWTKNDFVSSDPLCIVGATLDAVALTSPTVMQLDGAAGTFNSTITNRGTKLTDVALRSLVTQGPYTRRTAGLSLVDCRGALGLLPRGVCPQTGDTLGAHNGGGGRGTLAVGGATARVELVRVLGGDTGVVDFRTVPITISRPATGSYWEILPPMPTPRSGVTVAVANDMLYAVGGFGADWSISTRAVEAYDPINNSWTVRASLPASRWNPAAAAVGGVIYVVGGFAGYSYTGAVEAYDPVANAWSSRAPMPTARDEVGLGVIDGVLYAVGGYTANGVTGVVEAYDPATNTWTTKAPMPTPRRAAAGVIDGVLYAVGGYAGSYQSGAVEAYDPATDSWSARASLPPQSMDVVVGVVNGMLYALNGAAAGNVEVYDPATDTWAASSMMPTPRWGSGVGAINGVLYTVGGTAQVTYTYTGTVEAYHP